MRQKDSRKVFSVFSFIVLAGFFFLGCPPTNIFTEREIQFYDIAKGPIGSSEALDLVIRSEEEYQLLYGVPSDGFNFEDEMMIATYKGQLFNGGYGYDIVRILEEKTRLVVTVQFTPCSPCTRNLTSPYHIVGLEQNDKPVVFEKISGDGSDFNERQIAFRPYPDLNIQVDEPSYFVIRTEEEFNSLTGESSDGFDFENEMLIAAYLGSLPNGGYGWEITNIVEVLNEIIVEVQFTPCSPCTRAFSYEVDVVATDQSEKDVYFYRVNLD